MGKEKKAGVIYILTNPSFPDYVKIGYATDIEKRLAQLNRSECIPFAFRVYAIYEVSAPLQDKELHSLIDRLNPELRAIDTFDGKTRTKEFYAMSAEDAYALLESIAKLSGTMDKLRRLTPRFWMRKWPPRFRLRQKRERPRFHFSNAGSILGLKSFWLAVPILSLQ